MVNSSALNHPSGPSVRTAKCRGRSASWTIDGSISFGNIHAALPSPVATACHTSSAPAGSSTSRAISNSLAMGSMLLGRGRDGGMQRDHEAVRPPAGGTLVVVAAGQVADRVGQLLREGRAVGARGEADLRVGGEGGELAVRRARAADELADLADEAGAEGQQPARRELVADAVGIGRQAGERGGRDDVRRRGGPQDALGASALAPLLDALDEAVALQRAQVVVRLLARQAG